MGGAQIAEIDGAAWNVSLERSGRRRCHLAGEPGAAHPDSAAAGRLDIHPLRHDSVVPPQDSDVTVRFVYFDRQINPHPSSPGFRFTLPPGSFRPPRPRPLCDCCCLPPASVRRGSSRVGTRVCRCDQQRRLRRPPPVAKHQKLMDGRLTRRSTDCTLIVSSLNDWRSSAAIEENMSHRVAGLGFHFPIGRAAPHL